MKKAAVFLVALVVIWLGLDYHFKHIEELGENLVADAYHGDLLAVKNDLENGAPLDYVFFFYDEERDYNDVYFNALQAAASGGNEDVINFLLEQGMNINAPTPQGWTPLFIAVRDGQAEAAKLLIYRGANLNAQTDRGATALMMAVTQKFPSEKVRRDLLLYLLKRGADPNQKDAFGHSAFYYAAALQNADSAELLYEYGAAPTDEEKKEIRELLKAEKGTDVTKIRRLLNKKPKKAPLAQEADTKE